MNEQGTPQFSGRIWAWRAVAGIVGWLIVGGILGLVESYFPASAEWMRSMAPEILKMIGGASSVDALAYKQTQWANSE